ncbi:MAG: peptide chain release factor N(5)-glutamine methyltransferase [Acidobacteriota bacterium]
MSVAGPSTIGALLRAARRDLAAAPFDPETREASLLLSHVLGRGEASLLAYPEEPVGAALVERFRRLLARRLTGEPVAYLFGEREFYGRPFAVDPRVLIPRPETEHLIEAALALPLPAQLRIVDVGTGSGCIAITLALEIPGARLLATDVSLAALQVARANARRHGVAERVRFVQGDLAGALRLPHIDLLVSNPPYVALDTEEISPEVKGFEPHQALFAADHGRSILRRLIEQAESLPAAAHLIVEIGYDQGGWIEAVTQGRDPWHEAELIHDYAALPRTVVLRRATAD